MKRKVFSLSSVFTSFLAFSAPLTVSAIDLQSDFMYTYPSTGGSDSSGLFGVFIIAVWCSLVIFSLFVSVIWILSIIDIIKRDNWKNENDKILWLLLVIFVPIADLYYYFFYRKTLNKGTQSTTPTT